MSSLFTRGIAIGAILVFLGAGCRSTPASDRAAAPAPAPGGVLGGSIGACDHPYFPVRAGYSLTYKNSYNSLIDGTPQVDRYTLRITEADASRAKMEVDFTSSGLRSTQDISCADGVLRTSAYLDLSGGRSISARTISSSGEYLPRDLRVGSAWSQTFNLEMRPNAGSDLGAMPNMSALATISHQALREESVTVPSGTYTAIVVKSSTSMRLDIAGSGATAADLPPMEFESLGYWVRGVGLVKSVAQMGGGFTATSEAETIVIP